MAARLIIVGAGSVGTSLGARLLKAGRDVAFVVRRPEQAEALKRHGLSLEDPASGERFNVTCPVTLGFEALEAEHPSHVLLCVPATETAELAPALAQRFPHLPIVSVQNDVDNESKIAKHHSRVIGAVWRQTCTRISDHEVRALGRARVILGAYPEGEGEDVQRLATEFRAAGLDVAISGRIMQDKWLKFCVNLMSAPNALVRPEQHVQSLFVLGKVGLLAEAREVLSRAEIVTDSCDGKDRSIAEEIEFQKASLARGTSSRRVPVFNQVWRSLKERSAASSRARGPSEAECYHERIITLGAQSGVPTPLNQRMKKCVAEAYEQKLGPECFDVTQVFDENEVEINTRTLGG
ncbi:MAG TPA: 2-dehydropantoate 2-reductase N-terminal domain-containing protein [Polyangiaceae bacterium]|nr:2-dehydropantoate 2-reductase N-terminal domain-containing protein [Polyangiaceae bacterium]